MPAKPLMMVKEVAGRLRLGVTKVYELVHERKLTGYRMDGAIRICPDSVDEYLERSRIGGTSADAEAEPNVTTLEEVSHGKARKGRRVRD
jgi:excisionase family DNA binding protein